MPTWIFEPGHTAAEFRARHMMVSWVRGHFKDVHGTLEFDPDNPVRLSLETTIQAHTLWTGEPQRDNHLRSPDFLDVENFPRLTFVSTGVSKRSDSDFAVTGDLSIHGVTRKVTFDFEELSAPQRDPWGNQRIGLSGTTKINRKDYGLTWNTALETGGFLVGDEVTITLDVQFVKS